MEKTPAVLTCRYPATDETFAGSIMLRIASGAADLDEITEDFTAIAEEFAEYFPDETPVAPEDVPALVDAIAEEHQRVVTAMSPDADALLLAMDDLLDAGIVVSFGQGYDADDAIAWAEDAADVLQEEGLETHGYAYSHAQDLSIMIMHQALALGFGTFTEDGAGAEDVARTTVEILSARGLKASWSGDITERIIIEPILFEAPLEEDDEDEEHEHSHA